MIHINHYPTINDITEELIVTPLASQAGEILVYGDRCLWRGHLISFEVLKAMCNSNNWRKRNG